MKTRVLSASFAVLASSLVCIGLTVAPADAAAPSNDLIAGATLITGESGTIDGTTAEATWTAEDPAGDNFQGMDPDFTKSVWYRITAPDDVGLRFTVPYGRTGISVGTFVSYSPGTLNRASDRYSANGWGNEVSTGTYETVAATASVYVTDQSQDDPPSTVTYYVRVKTTTAGAGAFTLNWSEGGLPSTTTASTANVDHVVKTFDINPSTTCEKSFYSGPPPTPTEAAYTGYYIVRDENGQVVGSTRRWDFYNPDGTTPPKITGLPLLPGSHTYTVRFYEGTAFLYCKRSQAEVTVVEAQPTVTQLKAVVAKQTVTFTGSITPAPPQGSSIQVLEKNNSVAGLVLKTGAGTYVLAGVKPGKHTYAGWFGSPFAAFANSYAAPITVTVPKYTTTTTLAAPRTAKPGARPIVKARVLVGKVLAQGNVQVRVNGTLVSTTRLVKGVATVKLPKLKRGRATVTATYVTTTLNASSKATRVIVVRR